MKISDFGITKHELRFKNPFTISGRTFASKVVYHLTLTAEDGNKFTGECAPFPQFGTETAEDAEKLIRTIKPDDINPTFLLRIKAKFPAVHAGIEQALLQLRHGISEQWEAIFPGIQLRSEIRVNAVAGIMSGDETLRKVKSLLGEGYSVIKLKIGRENPLDDIEILRKVRGELGFDFGLRLDLNGGWDVKTSRIYLPLMEKFQIEYIEQPVKLLHDFLHIRGFSTIPVAADESLMSYFAAMNIIENELAQVFIIKPAVLGGITEALKIITLAENNGIKPVVTTSLESSLGKRMAVFCAAALKDDTHCGLSTAGMISNDPGQDLLPVQSGLINYGSPVL